MRLLFFALPLLLLVAGYSSADDLDKLLGGNSPQNEAAAPAAGVQVSSTPASDSQDEPFDAEEYRGDLRDFSTKSVWILRCYAHECSQMVTKQQKEKGLSDPALTPAYTSLTGCVAYLNQLKALFAAFDLLAKESRLNPKVLESEKFRDGVMTKVVAFLAKTQDLEVQYKMAKTAFQNARAISSGKAPESACAPDPALTDLTKSVPCTLCETRKSR